MRRPVRVATHATVLLWALLLWGHWLFASPEGANFVRIPSWARMGSSALLVGLAALAALTATGDARRFARFMTFGMAWGALGDLLLAGWFPLAGPTALALGMGAFAVGHGAYLVAFRTQGRLHVPSIAALVASAVVGWVMTVLPGTSPSPGLSYGALVYGVLLASMTGAALGLALRDRVFRLLALGALLFFASDLVLSLELFRPELFHAFGARWRGDLVWLLYGHGQLLLVTQTGRGLAVRHGAT